MNRIIIPLAVFLAASTSAAERTQAFAPAPVKTLQHANPIPPAIPPNEAPPPKPKYLILPPVEYDHAYKGKLTVETVQTREELKTICGSAFTQFTLACAFRRDDLNSCHVAIVQESIIKDFRWTRALVMRHEIGHCNGWPGDHPGERPYDAK